MATGQKKILVAYASKHGSTREIASVVADVLRQAGHRIDLQSITKTTRPSGHSAVILGSAVYMGNWRPEAVHFVETNSEQLRAMPVWLFSTGPVGTPLKPARDTAVIISGVLGATGATGHAIFAGKISRAHLNLAERIIAKAVHASEGDYRNWDEIRAWASTVAAQIGKLK